MEFKKTGAEQTTITRDVKDIVDKTIFIGSRQQLFSSFNTLPWDPENVTFCRKIVDFR